MADGILTPCSVACGSGIVTVKSPSGSTVQCNTWLWDDMPLNSPKHPPYWNCTSGFAFDHIIAVDMSFCTSLLNIIQTGPPSVEKKWRHVDFQDGGSQPNMIAVRVRNMVSVSFLKIPRFIGQLGSGPTSSIS